MCECVCKCIDSSSCVQSTYPIIWFIINRFLIVRHFFTTFHFSALFFFFERAFIFVGFGLRVVVVVVVLYIPRYHVGLITYTLHHYSSTMYDIGTHSLYASLKEQVTPTHIQYHTIGQVQTFCITTAKRQSKAVVSTTINYSAFLLI